jgi:hypothetical protein
MPPLSIGPGQNLPDPMSAERMGISGVPPPEDGDDVGCEPWEVRADWPFGGTRVVPVPSAWTRMHCESRDLSGALSRLAGFRKPCRAATVSPSESDSGRDSTVRRLPPH